MLGMGHGTLAGPVCADISMYVCFGAFSAFVNQSTCRPGHMGVQSLCCGQSTEDLLWLKPRAGCSALPYLLCSGWTLHTTRPSVIPRPPGPVCSPAPLGLQVRPLPPTLCRPTRTPSALPNPWTNHLTILPLGPHSSLNMGALPDQPSDRSLPKRLATECE